MDDTVVARLRGLLREREDVMTAYLFGSAADRAADAADLDVAVTLRDAARERLATRG